MAPRPERGAAALASSNQAYPIEYMGQACVELLLPMAKMVRALQAGEVLTIVTDDVAAREDLG